MQHESEIVLNLKDGSSKLSPYSNHKKFDKGPNVNFKIDLDPVSTFSYCLLVTNWKVCIEIT